MHNINIEIVFMAKYLKNHCSKFKTEKMSLMKEISLQFHISLRIVSTKEKTFISTLNYEIECKNRKTYSKFFQKEIILCL